LKSDAKIRAAWPVLAALLRLAQGTHSSHEYNMRTVTELLDHALFLIALVTSCGAHLLQRAEPLAIRD